MSHFKCAECGKELPTLIGCWWRHYYDKIEILCPRCARASVDGRTASSLFSCDVTLPRI